jgi:hypothetical protein
MGSASDKKQQPQNNKKTFERPKKKKSQVFDLALRCGGINRKLELLAVETHRIIS